MLTVQVAGHSSLGLCLLHLFIPPALHKGGVQYIHENEQMSGSMNTQTSSSLSPVTLSPQRAENNDTHPGFIKTQLICSQKELVGFEEPEVRRPLRCVTWREVRPQKQLEL